VNPSALILNRRGALIGGAALLVGGCASTSIATQWKEPTFAGPPLRRLLVLGISRQAATRRGFEDTVVASLAEQGVAGVPSYTVIAQDGPVEREVVVKAVRDTSVDGVLVARLVGRELETRRETRLEMLPHRSLHPGLGHAWARVYEVREREVIHAIGETSVYRVSDGALVWTAITDTLDPTNVVTATRGFSRTAIAALKKDGLL
jgi:hypothetical protein